MNQQQFYPQQNNNETGGDDETDPAVQMNSKNRLTHRRATTNLIQPTNSMLIKPVIQSPNNPVFNDDIVDEREKLMKYIMHYTGKRFEVPVTTLDYYKFMKLIGKGAFGKVTLGIHKLTGKQVAIKTVDKSLMKDEYQKKKVL